MLSVIIITRNEEENIGACLESVRWADEILLVDSGSTDKTLEIAKQFSARVVVEADWQGFGVQRQRAQHHASGDWIFMIDADERVTPELKDEISHAVNADDKNVIYAVPRLTWFFGRFMRHSGWYPAARERLYAKQSAKWNSDRVHEALEKAKGTRVNVLKGDLLHFTYRSMNDYLLKSAKYAEEWSEQRFQKGKRVSLIQAIIHAKVKFLSMYFIKRGFLDGPQGLLLAIVSSYSVFSKYVVLWTRYQNVPTEKRKK